MRKQHTYHSFLHAILFFPKREGDIPFEHRGLFEGYVRVPKKDKGVFLSEGGAYHVCNEDLRHGRPQ